MKKALLTLVPVLVAVVMLPFGCKPITFYLEQVYKVHGTVTVAGSDGGTPIGSAEVIVGNYEYSELTNYYGDYELEMPEGTWTINIHKDGYEPFTETVTVGPDARRVQVDAELVWIPPEVPIDLTGYWTLTLDIDGGGELGPFEFYIRQTVLDLYATGGDPSSVMTGSLDGPTVTLQSGMGTLTGTVSESGDEISGSFAYSPFGPGTFLMVPTSVPRGTLSLSGNCAGVSVSLDTDQAWAETGTESWTSSSFSVYVDPVNGDPNDGTQGWISFYGSPAVGDFAVMETPQSGTHQLQADFWNNDNSYRASGGSVHITEYDAQHMIGSYELSFPEGIDLSGTFNVRLGEPGHTTISGTLQGIEVDGSTDSASFDTRVDVSSHISLSYFDDSKNVWLLLSIHGLPSTGTHTGLDFWGNLRYGVAGEPQTGDVKMETGTLNLTKYDQSGAAGNFVATFQGGGTVNGEFNVPFAVAGP